MDLMPFNKKINSKESVLFFSNNLKDLLLQRYEKQKSMVNISIPQLFEILERDNLLISISKQIHLSEMIESICGLTISEHIRRQRGFFLNIERSMVYFFLFYKIFLLYDNYEMMNAAYSGYTAGKKLFESTWDINYPWAIARPGIVPKELKESDFEHINNIIRFQQRMALKIAKFVEMNQLLIKSLKKHNIIEKSKINSLGITGPILRSFGIVPQIHPSTTLLIRKSSDNFCQYAFTTEGNFWNLIRVSYTELILSLNRVKLLLEPISSADKIISETPINGELTSSFPTALGDCHLTIGIVDNEISYYNFIPPEMSNLYGIMKILTSCHFSVQSLILLYLNPRISIQKSD